jgi:hypothetical protein
MSGAEDLRLPEGAVLLHIGPFKTGTTAIQGALQQARSLLPEHGALYPGTARRAARPGWAVLGRKQRGRPPVPIEEWKELAAEVAAAPHLRVCVSTEDFGSASPAQVERIVADLGGDRVHVVAVARRLDRLLPSQWQERVKSHDRIGYDDWLRAVLGTDAEHFSYRNFWASHDLVRTFDRWTPTVGRDRFRLVVSDDGDPERLPRVFERMLDLPEGLLQLAPYRNQSLTMNGIELVRRLNEVFEERGWPDELYFPMLQRGLMQALIDAADSPYEERIPRLPAWAVDRVAELSEQRAQQLAERGAVVVGDLRRLQPDPVEEPVHQVGSLDALAIDSAAVAVVGAVDGALRHRRRLERARSRELRRLRSAEAASPPDPSGRELLGALARRVRRRIRW